MIKDEFIKCIKSIGFIYNEKFDNYEYVEFRIFISPYAPEVYHFWTGSEWIGYYYSDLTPIDKYFKKVMRSIKLKGLLR